VYGVDWNMCCGLCVGEGIWVCLFCCVVMCFFLLGLVFFRAACVVCLAWSWWCGLGDCVLRESVCCVVLLRAVCDVSLGVIGYVVLQVL